MFNITLEGEDYTSYVTEIDQIINHPDANDNVILTAKCELILFEGYKNNTDYLNDIAQTNAMGHLLGPDVQTRIQLARKFINANAAWAKKVEDIIAQTVKENNHFAYFTALINYVKVSYQFDVFAKYVYVVKELPGHPLPEQADKKEFYTLMQQRIGLASNYFSEIGHIENTIVAMSAFYELLHYLEDFENAKRLLDGLETMANNYDLEEFKVKVAALKNGGTAHENLKRMLDGAIGLSEEEFAGMKKEMMQMDETERKITNKPSSGNLHIDLFPIGIFQFPASDRAKVYEILCLDGKARAQFDQRFSQAIPIANILLNPITHEGPQNADASKITPDEWKNIYRVRKLFFENRFYRNETIRMQSTPR